MVTCGPRLPILAYLLTFAALGRAGADLVVDAPQPLTHCVKVQPIRCTKTTGETATVFGDARSELHIKREVNRVWAQAGVRIDWLPVIDHTNDFAFDGTPSDYSAGAVRPVGDFASIFSSIATPPLSSDPTIINMLFVEVVPGFTNVGETSANGRSNVDRNGIIVQVGDVMVTLALGRDLVAAVLGHEIGHNLGLNHAPTGTANFMAPSGSTDQMTAAQAAQIFSNRGGIDSYEMLHPIPSPSNYELWAYDLFLAANADADFDRDTVVDLLEFLLGLDPLTPDSGSVPPVQTDGSGLVWTLQKTPGAAIDGIPYNIVVSNDLVTWLPAGTSGTSSTVVIDTDEVISVRLDRDSKAGFMRLESSLPAP